MPDLIDKLHDREWRLNNIYLILVDGRPAPFIPRPEQLEYRRARHTRNFTPKARKLGMSTEIVLENGDDCVFNPNFKAAIIDETEPAAWEKLEIFRFAWLNGPNHPDPDIAALWVLIHEANPIITDNNGELAWHNGSSFQAGTSFTGRTPQRLHVSEFGPICDASIEKGRKIRRGSINAVLPHDIVDVETTMRGGRIGPCYDLFRLAKEGVGKDLTAGDWKLHFFSWVRHPAYTLPGRQAENADTLKYFRDLQEQYGITVSPERQAWYEKKKREQGEDMLQEFPTWIGECDMAIVLGCIYPQMAQVRKDGRVTKFSPDPSLPVFGAWDCGGDTLSGWLIQPSRREINVLDWKGTDGGGAAGLAAQVLKWEAEHGITLAKIFVPHDVDQKDKGSAKTFKAQMIEAGIQPNRIVTVPRIPSVWVGIGYVRKHLSRCWFHSRCDEEIEADGEKQPSGVGRLENYRRALNNATGSLQEHPLKDGVCDHAADGLRTFFEGVEHGLVPTMPATQAGVHPLDRDEDEDKPKRKKQAVFTFGGWKR